MSFRIQLMSDIHFEFHQDSGNYFFKDIAEQRLYPDYKKPDVLVLAGDIVSRTNARYYLQRCADEFEQIVFVPGNHEYYESEIQKTWDALNSLNISNLHLLDRRVVEIKGKRFVGATLWFCEADVKRSGVRENWLNDFFAIKGPNTREWIYSQHELSKVWLKQNVQPGDIVVTHHLPTYEVVSDRWKNSSTNAFFASNQLDTIYDNKPALWLYGHTHDSTDKVVGSTRCISNPFGYYEMETNPDFNFSFMIDL